MIFSILLSLLQNKSSQIVQKEFKFGEQNEEKQLALLADIGGTNARLMLAKFDINSQIYEQVISDSGKPYKFVFSTQNEKDLQSVIQQFINQLPSNIASQLKIAIFACAGPRKGNTTYLSNASHWGEINGDLYKKLFNLDYCQILNDFEANGHAVLKILESHRDHIVQLNPNALIIEGQTISLIGPGTGLGECILQAIQIGGSQNKYFVCPTEGGHAAFSPIDEEQCEYMNFLKQKRQLEYVCNEAAFAGISIQHMYEFYKDDPKYGVGSKVQIDFNASDKQIDPNSQITKFGFDGTDPACQKVVDLVVKLLACELSNMCLRTLSNSGIVIVGKIINDFLPYIKRPEVLKIFMQHFLNKDKMYKTLFNIPIYVIPEKNLQNEMLDLGFIGGFQLAQQYLKKQRQFQFYFI